MHVFCALAKSEKGYFNNSLKTPSRFVNENYAMDVCLHCHLVFVISGHKILIRTVRYHSDIRICQRFIILYKSADIKYIYFKIYVSKPRSISSEQLEHALLFSTSDSFAPLTININASSFLFKLFVLKL